MIESIWLIGQSSYRNQENSSFSLFLITKGFLIKNLVKLLLLKNNWKASRLPKVSYIYYKKIWQVDRGSWHVATPKALALYAS